MRIRTLLLTTAALALASALPTGAHANLIVNGGFETGDFTGYTQSGNIDGNTFVTGPGFGDPPFVNDPHSGNFFAVLGAVGSDGFLSQTFSDVAGQPLSVSFFLANDGFTPNDFSASFNSTSLLSVVNTGAQSYALHSFIVTATGSDTLTIGARSNLGFFGLDDINVSPLAVPEPASMALLGVGLLGLGLTRRGKAA